MILKTTAITEKFNDLEKVNTLAKEAFPPAEYLAPNELIEMSKEGKLDFWALYNNELFVGFMVVRVYKKMAYLFFLAISSEYRSSGYGARAIETLKELYPRMQQVVDLEKIDETAENFEQRKIRRSFYIRNGYKSTGQFLSYLGVEYEILSMDNDFDFRLFQEMLDNLQLKGFYPDYSGN